ncbi:MAG: biopolymer transporter ExbD [bacterium]
MKLQTTNKPLSAFSYSSLTDIVMLLLIFFLLTSQFVIQTGVKVKLPGAKNNEQVNPSALIVTLTERNQIYYGTEITSIDLLPAKLSAGVKLNEENNLIIKADKTVSIELVIKVMDMAKGIGIDKFTIETEKESF